MAVPAIIKIGGVLLVVVLLILGKVNAEDGIKVELSSKNSGYEGKTEDWVSFLSCWKETSERLPNYDEGYLLWFSDNKRVSNHMEPLKLQGVELPRSLLDFHVAYKIMGGEYRKKDYEDGIGLFAPEEIQSLSSYNNDLISIKNEWPGESVDSDYYKYGVEQDNAAVRTSYQNNAIVVGQYGFSDYELIVIYPDSITADGEMETALFAHASEARTPSFAEMMRQLSYFFTQAPDSIPIYSQDQLKSSCASILPLKDIWWK